MGTSYGATINLKSSPKPHESSAGESVKLEVSPRPPSSAPTSTISMYIKQEPCTAAIGESVAEAHDTANDSDVASSCGEYSDAMNENESSQEEEEDEEDEGEGRAKAKRMRRHALQQQQTSAFTHPDIGTYLLLDPGSQNNG